MKKNRHIYLKYLKYVMRHKWFVFIECCKFGIPLRGIIHDMSKFLPSEFFPYARYFGGDIQPNTADKDFDFAWLLHQKRNRHHWQWWLIQEDEGGVIKLPIPKKYIREMVADWRGAGRAQGKPDTKKWYLTNKSKIQMESKTRIMVERFLGLGE